MNHTMEIVSLPAKEFLRIKGYANLYDAERDKSAVGEDVWGMIRKQFSDGSVERLKKSAGSEIVYLLFCYTCERDDEKKCYVCSYDIVCENFNSSRTSEFDTIQLNACEYSVYNCDFDSETSLWDAHESTDLLFWGDDGWLKDKLYVCAIDYPENSGKGYAQIELYTPFDVDAKKFNMKIWYPIIPKNN